MIQLFNLCMFKLNKFFIITSLISITFLFFSHTYAQEEPVVVNYQGTPFGGIITGLIPCTCSNNYLIYVVDLVSRSVKSIVVSPPFSRLYLFYTFNPGQWALGTFSPGPICLVTTTTGCNEIPSDGAINSGPGAGSSGFYPVSGL